MYLQITKNEYRHNAPPAGAAADYIYKNRTDSRRAEIAESEPAANGVNLPALATANDLREVVKFLKHKPHGVSAVELSSAEPRRVFDARKIAAYEFWGVLTRADERFQLTALGRELAKNTEAECAVHRRILRGVPAYARAVEWIFRRGLKIATFRDVAEFWALAGEDADFGSPDEGNIEAVIVSFFSLCHAAELGTATVGKRGQPARLSVSLDHLRAFLNAPAETAESAPPVLPLKSALRFDRRAAAVLATVYISAGRGAGEAANLCAALELADFAHITLGAGDYENGFLPLASREALKQCQAAIFLLGEADCCEATDGALALCAERVTEISVAEALFGERVLLYWNGAREMPASFRAAGFHAVCGDVSDWTSNVKLVKYLKSLKD